MAAVPADAAAVRHLSADIAGSTGGGLKVIPHYAAVPSGARELKRLAHPNAVYTIKLGAGHCRNALSKLSGGFFSAYALVFVVSMLLLIATGVDEFSAFSAIATTLNNTGPVGYAGENFTTLNPGGKWILVVTMLFGRLEVFLAGIADADVLAINGVFHVVLVALFRP